jgi:hypothetical protein
MEAVMLRKDLNDYLILTRSERCSQAEYAYRCDVLKEFLSLVGEVPYAQLQREDLTDIILQMAGGPAAGEPGCEHSMKVRFTVERFLLWLQSQSNDSAHVRTVKN